jgi:hypothetical protein
LIQIPLTLVLSLNLKEDQFFKSTTIQVPGSFVYNSGTRFFCGWAMNCQID